MRMTWTSVFLGFAIAGCNTMNPVGRLDRDTPGQGTCVVQGQADVTGELWPVVTEPQEQPGQLAKTAFQEVERGQESAAVGDPQRASVQQRNTATFSNSSREGTTALRGAIGFTLDPETFLMGFEGNYFANENFALGPLLQLGVSGNRVILAPTVNFRGVFDLPARGLEQLKPFVQGGLGLGYLHRDNRKGDNDDVGFLFNFGGGADFYLTDDLALGSNLLFNIMPDKVLGKNFFFSWQFVSLTVHF